MIQEKIIQPRSGWGMLVLWLLYIPAFVLLGVVLQFTLGAGIVVAALAPLLFIAFILIPCGFQAIQPNEARVYTLFGVYKGSAVNSGFYWVNPFYGKRKLSLRVRNFETGSQFTPEHKEGGIVKKAASRSVGRPAKVNDRDGNPIEISAVVVWRAVNTAEIFFEVDDYMDFVAVQSEAALRNLASRHPYDNEDGQMSLRGNTDEVAEQLKQDMQDRLRNAGIEVIEARLNHLAYASEIASVMLRRQQAQAVIAARARIVEGAVSMVEGALTALQKSGVVQLDEERRAAMISNLLVVLCSESHTQPVVNTGSIY
jgi:regulator of protease activity HflC (stomatin/prohibitin superfamily)